MKFIIQKNLIYDENLKDIIKSLSDYDIEFVEIIPFTNEIISDNELSGIDYIPYGSTKLTVLSHELNWRGCHFDLSKFNYETALLNRSDMLNDNVITIDESLKFLSNKNPNNPYFIRPSEDLKQFSGQVCMVNEIIPWFNDMITCASSGSYKLEKNTKVIVSEPKYIDIEWRWFIVGGKIISGSKYKLGNRLYYERELDNNIINEAQQLANIWLPNECCVMDVAKTDYGNKVIEFNCINSSGFYDCDIENIFIALYEYHNGVNNE